jgi:hypothetical protein
LIHITCIVPADNSGGISMPALVAQMIINPTANTAWIQPACGTSTLVPAYVNQGMIIFKVGCKFSNGTTSMTTYPIDRYTGTYTESMSGNPLNLSGQCIAGQKQLF